MTAPTTAAKKLLVVGALGVVGRAVMERCAGRAGLQVVGLARRAPDFAPGATWVSADLRDAAATRAALAPHRDTTHVVYAALNEQPNLLHGWRDPDNVALNTLMLNHTLAALDTAPLARMTLLQGTKAYGVHTRRPMRVPAREHDAIRDHANFYFDQHDLVAAHAQRRGYRWTIFRPQIVLGNAVGSAMNPVATLGVYATLMRELGQPLACLGHPQLLTECTDARLIASAIEWAWGETKAHDEVFNITNGDVLLWANLFERLAREFAVPLGAASTARPSQDMPRHADLWRGIAQRHNLRVADMDALIGLSWQYAEATWASLRPFPVPPLVSTIKLRQAGFGDCIDTEESIVDHLNAMREQRYLP